MFYVDILPFHPVALGSTRPVQFANVEGMTIPQPGDINTLMVGGVTYEESTKVNLFNMANVGKVRDILGGSTMPNSTSFLEELRLLMING